MRAPRHPFWMLLLTSLCLGLLTGIPVSSQGIASRSVVGDWIGRALPVFASGRSHVSWVHFGFLLYSDASGRRACTEIGSPEGHVLTARQSPSAAMDHVSISLGFRDSGFVACTKRTKHGISVYHWGPGLPRRSPLDEEEIQLILGQFHGHSPRLLSDIEQRLRATGSIEDTLWSGWFWTGAWAVALLATPFTILAARRDLRRYARLRRGSCPECGYSLEGLTADTCPECGSAVHIKPMKSER